jgi:short-subunit dehydrogenase
MSAMSSQKWALVTGASSGIGEAFARELVRRGRSVIVVARREERLQKLAAELGGEGRAMAIAADLARPDEARRLHQLVLDRQLEVDLLVNNAGVGHTGPFIAEPLERILGMVDLNVRALTEMTRLFAVDMVDRKSGSIVNVVSTSAFQPVPFLAVYAATKAYVLSLTEALEVELVGTGVRVQALCPGNTTTEFQSVAGTDATAFNKTAALTPQQVAAYSLDHLASGGRVIPGWQNRVVTTVQGWLPRAVVRRVAGELFRPRGTDGGGAQT